MYYHPTANKIGQPVENSAVKKLLKDVNNVKFEELMSNVYNLCYSTLNNYWFDSYEYYEIINQLENIGYTITYMNDEMNGLVKVTFNDICGTYKYFIVYDDATTLYTSVSLTIRNSTVDVYYEQQGFYVSAYEIENGDIYTGILESIYRLRCESVFGETQSVRTYDEIKMIIENIGYELTVISNDGSYEGYRFVINDFCYNWYI